jgi:type II secretory pathway component PulL
MPHKQSRYERKIARDAEMKPRGLRRAKVYLHSHLCTCTKKWLCREAQEICGAKEQDCVQCSEKKRAIEAENNSGEQLHIDFDEPRTCAYTDFISFSDWATNQSVLYQG